MLIGDKWTGSSKDFCCAHYSIIGLLNVDFFSGSFNMYQLTLHLKYCDVDYLGNRGNNVEGAAMTIKYT